MNALVELWAKHIVKGNKSENRLVIFPENFQAQVRTKVEEKRASEKQKEETVNE